MLACKDFLEASDGFLQRYISTWGACELFSYEERLRQESLDLSCASNDDLVVIRKFFHTEDGDDILQFFVALQNSLYAAGYFVVFLAEYVRIKDTGSGVQRIDCRVNTQFGDGTVQYRGSIQMGEYASRSRVGEVIGRYIYSLNGCDGTGLGGSDSFLQFADIGCERWLVTYGRRHTAEQCGYFGACLYETENVVDEEQYVLALFITEVFCHGQTCQGDSHTSSRRFVHLAIDQCYFVQDAGVFHFAPEVVAFTGTFAYAAEYGAAIMFGRYVVDQFLNQDCFTYACTAEQTDLTAFCVWADQVDDFDAGFENFSCRGLVFEGRCRAMNRPVVRCRYFGRIVIYCLSENVENTSKAAVAYRCCNSTAGVDCFHSTYHAICGAHSYGTDDAVAEVLHGFTDNINRNAGFIIFYMDCVIDSREFFVVIECNIYDCADDLDYFTYLHLLFICHEEAFLLKFFMRVYSSAAAPPTISEISLVTCA